MNPLAESLREAARLTLPPADGELTVAGVRGGVEVLRDRWGVPHIYADDERDLFFAQGFVTASERLFQIELALRLATGTLSGILGELTLPLDRFSRTVGWNRAGRAHSAAWSDRSREVCDAFAAGMRAWVEAMPAPPPEYALLQTAPWVPGPNDASEVLAACVAMVAWSLSRGWDNDLLRAEVAERLGPEAVAWLFPDADGGPPAAAAGAGAGAREQTQRLYRLELAALPPSGEGSNAWAVSGRRTATGKPLLANDPHLAIQLPSPWFEVHLSGAGLDAAGVAFPFLPGVVVGHNGRIAWGLTNGEGDVQDLYLERLSDDGARVEYRGRWEPVTVHREAIEVRGRDDADVIEVRETRHGPILDSYTVGIAVPEVIQGGIRRTYALRWVGHDRCVEPATLLRLNAAKGWDEFRDALSEWTCPGQNVVYADVDGNIGYQLTGAYPIRRSGDGSLPVPGWTDEYEWTGWIPFEELPRALNPPEGFVCTANNRPHGDSYPHLLGRDFLPGFRARRVAEMIAERPTHSRASFAGMQVDTLSLSAGDILPRLLQVEPVDDRQKQALTLLSLWDRRIDAESAPAAIYEAWLVHLLRAVLLPPLGEELYAHFHARRQWTSGFLHQGLRDLLTYPVARWFGADGTRARDEVMRAALDAALDELTERLGEEMSAWRWGAVHVARFAGRFAMVPELTELYTVGEVALGGDDQTVLQGLFEPGAGYDVAVLPSWRQIIDLSDLDASVGTLATGQSGNPASPHFGDHLELWRAGRHHAMPFTREAVEAAAESRLRLTPG